MCPPRVIAGAVVREAKARPTPVRTTSEVYHVSFVTALGSGPLRLFRLQSGLRRLEVSTPGLEGI